MREQLVEQFWVDRIGGLDPPPVVAFSDWSTLETFQRTRGVLRLMAAVIHELWERGDSSLMVMPASVPIGARPV